MLRGRGSLIRLIGKRRRILPNRQTLLASPHQQESLVSPKQENGEGSSSNHGGQKVHKCGDDVNEKPNTDLVNCPVCGKSIRGSDRIVNSHLDTCLTRGTKRKLAQRTLLQFSFGSRPIDNFNLHDLDNIEANMTQRGLNEMNHFFVPLNSHLRSETREDVLVEDPSREVSVEDKELGTPSIPDISEPNGCSSLDDILMPTLNTSIVGRRFSDKVELKQGDIISLLRDPFNVKDPNAIKVISPDAECIKVIGFLPRELTSYLSPLIDNYQLRFEGSVMSPPKHSLDTVPIQISGQKMAISSENDSHDNQVFESLWKSVLHVVEYAKNSLPNTAKYQQNFCTLIQEVMKNHRHLFTDDEKLFIDSFSSLSDDSQRIFIRLYTRKGPWFRMSNISYQEILDSEQAIEELCAMGYMRFFKSMNKLHDFDFKEVLDVLTVSELREILSLRCLKLPAPSDNLFPDATELRRFVGSFSTLAFTCLNIADVVHHVAFITAPLPSI
ncbi:hypothetical protein GIB67_010082 [Kingdonia uniflora]|uniref:Fanconi-associated nuclease n=1 Tax=Kingdonia uniflora TaxID=39325 RepID=A0A7J7PAF6_9MAGN|nr:hypothetical protein GIB67_010082 [Kingdonia uniflora]